MFGKQRLRLGAGRFVEGGAKRAPGEQRGREAPRAFAQPAHFNAGLRAVHKEPDRSRRWINCRGRRVVLRVERAVQRPFEPRDVGQIGERGGGREPREKFGKA